MLATLLVTVVLIGAFAWPTRWRFEHVNGAMVRIERASGRAWVLDPDRGWIAIPDSAPAPNPFADVAAEVNARERRR